MCVLCETPELQYVTSEQKTVHCIDEVFCKLLFFNVVSNYLKLFFRMHGIKKIKTGKELNHKRGNL